MESFLKNISDPVFEINCPTVEALEQCSRNLASLLEGGDFVGLVGDLGAGKTTFSRQIVEYFNVRGDFQSPSYSLMREYKGDLSILHLDAYFEHRLESLLGEGVCEEINNQNLLIVEWANHATSWWPQDGIYVGLAHHSKGGRILSAHACGERSLEIVKKWHKFI